MPSLPERAGTFLDILRRFLAEPAMDQFGRGARRAFLEGEDEIEEDEVQDLLDYVLFGHRDAGGRSLVDHFLSTRGGTIAPEEREVIERFRESIHGVFHVEEVEPGRGFTLRRSGADGRFEVVDVEGSRSIRSGMGVITRLVPYRGRHEVSGALRVIPPEAAYVSERITARIGEAAAEKAMDPIALRRLFKRKRPAPPENRLEAELHAASVFAELKFPLSVEEAQRRFQSMESCTEILKTHGFHHGSREDLQRFADAVTSLWNHTPRDELGGLSPAEKQAELAAAGRPEIPLHILEDMKNEVVSRIDPEAFPDDESRRAAILEVQERWLSTPQKELGGRTPREVIGGSLPSLPDESSLPPPDRPAWPLERIRDLLASRKPAGMLWAVRRAAALAEPIAAAEITRALACLLDDAGEAVVERALAAVPEFAGHPAAREVAAAVAARLPSLGEGTHEQMLALRALARLTPSEHVQAFADGLESGDEMVEIAALEGIAAGRSEGAVIILLGFLAHTNHAASAAVSLAGLAGLRSAELAERGAEVFIESFVGEDNALEGPCAEVEQAMGIAAGLFVSVENSLYPSDEEPPAAAARRSVFLPRDDPAAARRGEEVVGPDDAGRILALADAGKHVDLARLLGDLALEAIELASRENPAFGPLGQTLAGIARGVLEWEGLRDLEPDDQKVAASLLGAFLAKAIRGRDIARELEDAAGDRAKILDLCRVDEPWVDERTFERLARAIGEEDLARLSTSTDSDVLRRTSLLLAATDPRRHLKEALAALVRPSADRMHLVRGLVRVAGDSILSPLVDAVREETDDKTIGLFADVLKILGTERARACFGLYLEELHLMGFSACELLETASAAGSRSAAEKVIALMREGAFDLADATRFDLDLDDLAWELQTCLEVFGIPGDADEILAEGLRQSGGSIRQEEYPFLEDEDDPGEDEEEDDEDGGCGWDDPDCPDPVAPIIRDAPKIGRNDPCPCGSGKKHKKCCGRSA